MKRRREGSRSTRFIPIPTTAPWFELNRCSNHEAIEPDARGGYLIGRIQMLRY